MSICCIGECKFVGEQRPERLFPLQNIIRKEAVRRLKFSSGVRLIFLRRKPSRARYHNVFLRIPNRDAADQISGSAQSRQRLGKFPLPQRAEFLCEHVGFRHVFLYPCGTAQKISGFNGRIPGVVHYLSDPLSLGCTLLVRRMPAFGLRD